MASALLYRVNKWGGEGEAISPDYRGRYIFPVELNLDTVYFSSEIAHPSPTPSQTV